MTLYDRRSADLGFELWGRYSAHSALPGCYCVAGVSLVVRKALSVFFVGVGLALQGIALCLAFAGRCAENYGNSLIEWEPN
jgi:hypothetical protein